MSENVEYFLRIFQSLAILEVINAAIGLVRSSAFTTAIQLLSRLFVVWGILFPMPMIKSNSYGCTLIICAWSIAEITRYMYYVTTLLHHDLKLLTILRAKYF
ncbi:unnamed protein product [Protopolystoma xenopodis]|uniref:Very-long-chain (3R)-3-hydroxyacyl-CoA dehydratase n=1 Tax=Protopolystoma xenopodis TaxID=117903 RepID=A0A3S5CJJ3_9PLAT|nr:unnamed protein product [Protopolystoma xenopodis]